MDNDTHILKQAISPNDDFDDDLIREAEHITPEYIHIIYIHLLSKYKYTYIHILDI